MQRAIQALGRLPAGQMNRTEAAYAAHLDARKAAGEILWWRFEGVTFRLAERCSLTPDFLILLASGALEAHDAKGSPHVFTDDAKVKMKVAARDFPLPFFVCFPKPKREGGWFVEEI